MVQGEVHGRAYTTGASVTSIQQGGPNPAHAEVPLLLFWVCSARMERFFGQWQAGTC